MKIMTLLLKMLKGAIFWNWSNIYTYTYVSQIFCQFLHTSYTVIDTFLCPFDRNIYHSQKKTLFLLGLIKKSLSNVVSGM